VPVSGDAPNIWVTRSTDSTKSFAKLRTWAAPDSSAEKRRVTDSFMIGHFTHLKLTIRRINSWVARSDAHYPGGLDATQWHTALIRSRCAGVSPTGARVLQKPPG